MRDGALPSRAETKLECHASGIKAWVCEIIVSGGKLFSSIVFLLTGETLLKDRKFPDAVCIKALSGRPQSSGPDYFGIDDVISPETPSAMAGVP